MNQFFTRQVLTKKFDGFLECLKKIQAIEMHQWKEPYFQTQIYKILGF